MATAIAEVEGPETVAPIVAVSAAAVRQVKRQQEKTGRAGWYLRLGVRGGGCPGLSYVIDMENQPDEFDLTWELDDIKVVVDRKSALYLKDSTLDYSIKNLMEGGFVFSNPQSLRSCGCGTSFTAK